MAFGSKGPFCQSCGMPMDKDEGSGGSEIDGSKSSQYCSHCYQNGQFTEPDITLEQMHAKVLERMKEMHIPKFLGKHFAKNLPNLKRWRAVSSSE